MISFSLKGLLSNGMSSIWDQKSSFVLSCWLRCILFVNLWKCSSSVLYLQNGNSNIYLGNVFITTLMHRYYSRFKWVRFTFQCFWNCSCKASLSCWYFCYFGFIKNLEIDGIYTVLFCFLTFRGTLSQSFVTLCTKLVQMM